jgi:hypothetical protein
MLMHPDVHPDVTRMMSSEQLGYHPPAQAWITPLLQPWVTTPAQACAAGLCSR